MQLQTATEQGASGSGLEQPQRALCNLAARACGRGAVRPSRWRVQRACEAARYATAAARTAAMPIAGGGHGCHLRKPASAMFARNRGTPASVRRSGAGMCPKL